MKYSGMCFVGLLLFLFTSCSSMAGKESPAVLDISLSSVVTSLRTSDIASLVECIPLGTNDSIIIGELTQVIVANDFIYAADNATVYKFTLSGGLVASICHEGNAPAEYISISDFQLDEEGNVWILSQSNKALYKYGWEGSLQKKINLETWVEKIHFLGNDRMLLYAGNTKSKDFEHALYALDMKSETIVNRNLLIDADKSAYLHVISQNHFSCNKEQGFFYQMFNDTIYSFNDEGALIPEYYLSMDGRNIPTSFYKHPYRDIMDFFQNLFKENYAYGTGLFMKNDRSYLFSLFYEKRAYWCAKGAEKTFISDVLVDDVCLFDYKMELSEISYFVQSDNQIVIPLSPYMIMDYAENSLSKEQQGKLFERIQYRGEEQNPVLLKLSI